MIDPSILRTGDLFSHFEDPALETLAECLTRARHPPGQPVVRSGEASFDAYFVESGRVAIGRDTPYGPYQLATLGPGDLFGETSFIDRDTRSGDVVPEVESVLLAFHPVSLDVLLERDRRIALGLWWTFWKSLSKKLRTTNERLGQFFSHTGEPSTEAAGIRADDGEDFRLDMAAKRRVFEEQKLSSLEINFLSSLSRERRLAPGEVLFREGDPGDALYVVLDGKVMISKHVEGAGEEALAFLERGDYFGEMALIDDEPRSADAKAAEGGAVVLAIPEEVLSGILDIERVSSLRLLTLLCSLVAKRLRELDDKIVGWYILSGGTYPNR